MRRKELKEVLRVIQNYHEINIISYLAGKNTLRNFELFSFWVRRDSTCVFKFLN